MKKVILGIVLGAVVYFAAGALSWMVMPWKNHGMKKIPEETLIRDTLKVVVPEPGLYFFPSDQTQTGRMDQKQHRELVEGGPVGLLFYRPVGSAGMGKNLAIGFLISLAVAAGSLWVLLMMRGRIHTFRSRFLTVMGFGAFIWFCSEVPNWNWMFHPPNYIFPVLLDYLFSFGLLGLVLGKFTPEEN